MKLKNEGFVATALLYGLLVVFLFLILGLLAMLQNRKMILDKLKNDIKNELNGMAEYKTYENGTAIYYNPVTNKICSDYTEKNSLNENKTGCMKWYIFNDNKNKATVNMILDHNTTAGVAWASHDDYIEAGGTEEDWNNNIRNDKGPVTILKKIKEDTKNWNITARLITANEVATVTSTTTFDGSNNTWFYLDGTGEKKQTQTSNNQKISIYSWLFDYTDGCKNYGCKVEDSNNNGYWVNDAVNGNSSNAWYIYKEGFFADNNVGTSHNLGIRPVITLSKKDIYVPYKEAILNGADPVYNDNLIPVTINVENGETIVKKADITEKWYSYKDKQWANAVVLKNNAIYADKSEIPLSNIESYFVWIPRYSYQIFNLGEYNSVISGTPTTLGSDKKTIQIKFGTNTTNDSNTNECTTPLTAGTKGECVVGDYMTHPAFLTMNTNGLWVGKYETGYAEANTTAEAQKNSSDSSKVIIQPDVYSWREINVKNAFIASYNYLRSNDSHMMKNTEWGAVAYLSHSKYGINKEVNINNNSAYKTGYSAVDSTDQSSYPGTYGTDSTKTLAYNTTAGYKASTTGNITGIYDMSGGAHEYMASYRENTLGSSGFTSSDTYMGSAYSKYFDVYPSDSGATTYGKRILGDATGEMGPFYNYKDNDNNNRNHNNWYADDSYLVESSNPWFSRSGHYDHGVLAGQFYFVRHTGGTYGFLGFRLVLSD